MIEQTVDIPTKDGKTTTFIVHPDRGGPFPVIVFYMDAPAIREELRDMARRLATSGYYVMLPNMYYRDGVMELGALPSDPMHPSARRCSSHEQPHHPAGDGRHRCADEIHRAATQCQQGQDGLRRLLHERAIRHQRRRALSRPETAAASIYGTKLVSDAENSPHLMAQKAKGEIYIGCAEHDSYVPMEMIQQLKKTIQDKKINAELEIYPGVHHGFAFPQRPVYDKASAERHWERLLSLYARKLKGENNGR
ncbi:MAG: dienelactone hydrolase family protein [Gemmatales bacterium]